MNFIRTKPLTCFSLTYVAISCLFVYVPPVPKLILTAIFLLFMLVFAVFGARLFQKLYDAKRIRLLFTVLFACAFVASGTSYLAINYHAQKFADAAEEYDTVTLEITDMVYSSAFSARYDADVKESEQFAGGFKIILDSEDISYIKGDTLTGTIQYHVLEEDINGYSEKRHSLSRKIMTTATDTGLDFAGHNDSFSLSAFFAKLNTSLCNKLYIHTGTKNGGLAAALLLGNRGELADSLKRDFRRLGISHMLSLSGAHLAILTTLAENFMLKLRIGKKKRAVINIAAVLLFTALTGFPPSLLRAGIMLILANLAFLVRQTPDYPTSLTFACALIIALNPYSAMDYSLHLSFVAAHSCYISSITGHRIKSLFTIRKPSHFRKAKRLYNRLSRYLMGMLVYNLVISVNMMPLTWLYFGELSLVSLPANLIYMPLITVLMYAALAFLLLYPLKIFVSPLANVISVLTTVISESAEKISALRGIMLPLNYWFTPIFILPLIILTAMAFSGKKQTIRITSKISTGIFAVFLLAVGVYSVYDRNNVYLEYVTAKKNDGLIVKTGGHLLICEVSDGSYTFASKLASQRTTFNSSEIEAYMLTHYHSRHTATLSRLTDNCIVRTLILPDPVTETDTKVHNTLVNLAREKGIHIIYTDRANGDTVYFNDAEIETYPFALLNRSTHPIAAVRLSYGDTSFMYLGGSFNEGNEVISAHAAEADYVIFGGHSPVYKKALDPAITAKATAVYLSEWIVEDIEKLSPGTAERIQSASSFTPGLIQRLNP